MLEGLAARVHLTALVRDVPGGRAVSQPTDVKVRILPANRVAFACSAVQWLLTHACDAVLVQGYGVSALAANLACRMRGQPCWMLVCSPAAEYYLARRTAGHDYRSGTLAGIRALAWANGRIGGRYIVLSDYLRTIVSRHSPRGSVHVVPVYGVDPNVFSMGDGNRIAVRRERGLPATGSLVFNSSRVAPEKDIATLIEAFRRLLLEGRDLYLLHRSGGYREFLQLAENAGIQDRVIATDAVDPRRELPLDYRAADVCVQASREEGLGFSVLEALACGTPVVASAVGGLTEIVEEGVTGWTAPPGDAAALAAAIRIPLDRPAAARRCAEAGAARVRARFDSERAFDSLVHLLTPPASHAISSSAQ